jgi:predicted regulator of Ras-like GTPase activity (Roadblock/LC7/MglB family)
LSIPEWDVALREVTGIAGVLGAVIVSADDGLVVAETAMEEVATADVAALASALITRATRCVAAMKGPPPVTLFLAGDRSALVAVAGRAPLWLVAVARQDAEIGRLRVLMRDFAGALQ